MPDSLEDTSKTWHKKFKKKSAVYLYQLENNKIIKNERPVQN